MDGHAFPDLAAVADSDVALLTAEGDVLGQIADHGSGVKTTGLAHGRELEDRHLRTDLGSRADTDARLEVAQGPDRDALASLPDGSLGRVYLEFMRREGISTEALDAEVEPVEREVIGPDPMRRRFNQHMRASHDLWHVLTGYHRDLLGELQVLMFSYRQTGSPAFKWITRLARLRAERQMPGAHALLDLASDRGERATCLATVDWERHLARPIDEVRTTLDIGPPPNYTRYVKNPSGRGLIPEALTP